MRRSLRQRRAGAWFGVFLVVALAWTASAAASESTLDQVLKRGKLLVGIGLAVPPFGMYDADKKPVGFDVDLAKLIANELKVEVEWVDTTSVNRLPYLLTNKVDLIVATFSATPERAKQIAFTKPYALNRLVLLGWKKDKDIKSYKDLKGRTVGVTRGTVQDLAITELMPEAKIVRYEDDPLTMLSFDQKKVETQALAEFLANAKYNLKTNKDLEVKGEVTRSFLSIGVRRNDQEWLNWLNTFLDAYGGMGKLSGLYEKWVGSKMAPTLPSW
jgi:polar amino acid transport system substrate-binding protein